MYYDSSTKSDLNFEELERLRLFCRQVQLDQVDSIGYFAWDVGFQHVLGRNKISVSSSATCVLSLLATGEWRESAADTKKLLHSLLAKDTSADLPKNNPFTTAWIIEAVAALESRSEALEQEDKERIAKKERILQLAIEKGKGGVSIAPYPRSPYLTQLVVRVLRRRAKLTDKLEKLVKGWAWAELGQQLALIHAKSKAQDAYAVAYLLMLVTSVTPQSKINPEQASIQRAALKTVFDCQLDNGTWPISRPLFHYPNFGNAHCYEYEMLTQLLGEPELRDLLLEYIPKLSIAAESVARSVYRVERGIPAWTSGHHPNQAEPESWATASVYHFVHQLDRLLAEAVRRELFRYLEIPLPRPGPSGKDRKDFADGLLDAHLDVEGKAQPLTESIWAHFVKPLSEEANSIIAGRAFRKGTPRSAIFFGPPGTSKTELSREIAKFLGWPLLAVDPSHLLKTGMDGIQAEANNIFRRLELTEGIVVLFDEFDELVRERGTSTAQPFSRLLTTAMLPKLANMHKRGTLVFIIATNNIDEFDLAIRRPGRFDRVIQIMPPTFESKMKKTDWGPEKNLDLSIKLQELQVDINEDIKRQLGDLTFSECDSFVVELFKVSKAQNATALLTNRWNRCTMRSPVSKEDPTTWAQKCEVEVKFISL